MRLQDDVVHEDDQIMLRSVDGCRLVGDHLFNPMDVFGSLKKNESLQSSDNSTNYDDDYDDRTGIFTFIEQGCWTDSRLTRDDYLYRSHSGTASEENDEILKPQRQLEMSLPQQELIESDISESISSSTCLTPLYLSPNHVLPVDPDAYEHLSDILSTKDFSSTSGNKDSHSHVNSLVELQKLRTIYETDESDTKQLADDGTKRLTNIFKCLFQSFKIHRGRKSPCEISPTSSHVVAMKTVELMNTPSEEDDSSIQSSLMVFDPRT